jgi:type II secretory pathway pseudopilin PulG
MPHHLHHYRPYPADRRSERGYILLILMLFVALLAIAAGALAPSVVFRARRDREEEMIHRGVQYSRALRRFVKKTGRYPSRLEELENTNNIRFLRKRYKDPITGKDFKLLHVGEVQLTSAAGIAGASALGGNAAAVAAAAGGGAAALLGAAGASGMLGGVGAPAAPVMPATPNPDTGADATADSGPNAGPGNNQSKTDASQPGGGTASSQLTSTVFGGGPIVGVASTSKAKSIREFNHKNHYNDWQFIYDPTMDRGGLITTPAQPALQVSAPPLQQNSSSPNNSSGSPSSFGGVQSPAPVQPAQTPQQ